MGHAQTATYKTNSGHKGTGRIPSPPDTRDARFTLRALAAAGVKFKLPKVIKYKRMYQLPALLPIDQGQTPRCTGYSLATLGIAGPILQKLGIVTDEDAHALGDKIWRRAQEIDRAEYGWPMTDEDGATTRSSVKAAAEFGLLGSYLWAEAIPEIIDFILHHGPAIAGTPWTDHMSWTGEGGWIEVDEARITGADVGGHQWALTGVDVKLRCPDGTRGAFRMAQTWGRGWGVEGEGRAFISFANVHKLWAAGGEFVLPIEKNLMA